jgi:hypothetical protein
MTPRLLFAVAVLGAGLAASGCGTGADRDRVVAVTASFYAALDHHAGEDACARLSPDLRTALVENEPGKRCARAVLALEARDAPIAHVDVYATSARVRLADESSVFLSLLRQGWRIAALGCEPAGSGPYECEQEA